MAEVDDRNLLARVDLLLEFIDSDAGDAQIAEEFSARIKLEEDVAGKCDEKNYDQPAAQRRCPPGNDLQLIAENHAAGEEGAGPQRGAQGIVQQKLFYLHAKDASKRCGHSVQ